MDFYIVLSRAGQRIKNRRHAQKRIGKNHRVTQAEAIEWFLQKYDGQVI